MLSRQAIDRLRADIRFTAELGGRNLVLHSTWGLFSPREIDVGTRLLLKHLRVWPTDDCLDLGCGYGPIGLAMAVLAPEGRTLMVDKDFVAVRYSKRNAERNAIHNARAQLSGEPDVSPQSIDRLPAEHISCQGLLIFIVPGPTVIPFRANKAWREKINKSIPTNCNAISTEKLQNRPCFR